MPRLARYLGRWIYHCGWYPDRKVRLYDRSKARWVGDFVHESVKPEGRVGHLESNILHFTCESLSEHLKTLDRYTTLAAQELAANRVRVPLWSLILDPYHDVLTDLPNRLLFRDRITVALAHARRTARSAAVMFLDLDQFKLVNDTLGHTVGDGLLQAIAMRLVVRAAGVKACSRGSCPDDQESR